MAHQGTKRTVSAMKLKYWWSTMNRDMKEYFEVCQKRARRKIVKVNIAPLGKAVEANAFLDTVSLDIVGSLSVTESGNKYLLTFIDHFT